MIHIVKAYTYSCAIEELANEVVCISVRFEIPTGCQSFVLVVTNNGCTGAGARILRHKSTSCKRQLKDSWSIIGASTGVTGLSVLKKFQRNV